MTDKMPDEIRVTCEDTYKGGKYNIVVKKEGVSYTRTDLINQQLDGVIEMFSDACDNSDYMDALDKLKQMRGDDD